jgi:hypothetical protein
MKIFLGAMWTDRPHPGPLRQEREKCPQPLCVAMATRNLLAFCFDGAKRGNRPIDSKKKRGIQPLFPLPGGEGQGEGGRNN